MASRRTRIKGIANIPQRKKPVATAEILTTLNDLKVEDENTCNENGVEKSTSSVTEIVSNNRDNDIKNLPNEVTGQLDIQLEEKYTICSGIDENGSNSITREYVASNDNSQNSNAISVDEDMLVVIPPKSSELSPEISKPPPSVRRKFLKPGINLNLIKQRNNAKEDPDSQAPINSCSPSPLQQNVKEEILENKVVVLSEIRIPTISIPSNVAYDITKIISEPPHNSTTTYSEITLNEAHFNANELPQAYNSPIVTFSPVKKFTPETHVSDSEYPAPPPSPSKINRSRIKAIPKLSLRKTSCSASESEDESRKYGRIRNNSVCSVASTSCLEPPTPISENAPSKETLSVVPKKINRTEQSRKFAEARGEFYKRFGTNMPDKQKLKMIDLIFYNPATNPMSQKTNNTEADADVDLTKKEKGEPVDDPPKNTDEEKEKENDSDNTMPVPQIKIGPSGEIVLDEQSLIVENVELAKQKEQIKNSGIVDGDFDTGYGIYKRARRASVWSHKETLRFYKALNLIGTDFTTMTRLFPKRNRRELKMKFKKEEKTNRLLIDKAIMQPCSYNFMDLKRELEIELEEEAFLTKLNQEEAEKLKQEKEAKRERKRKSEILDETPAEEVEPEPSTIDVPPKKQLLDSEHSIKPTVGKPPKPSKPKVKKSLNINSVLEEDDDADVSDMTQSDTDEEEIIPFLKPTRSGRMPKSTIKFTTPDEPPKPLKKRIFKKIDTTKSKEDTTRKSTFSSRESSPSRLPFGALRNRRFSSTSSVDSNSDRLVPGSVVITTEEGLNGQAEYTIFMVTPERKLTPLQLESDVIAKLVKEKQSAAEFPIIPTTEKNITIPAVKEISSTDEDKISL